MDVSLLLDGLNDKQRDAVAAPPSSMLVLAGAGSGKTRVLVHRLAWLMQVENCSPYSLLAVTFTNKAAAEMRGRVDNLLQGRQQGMWIGTFHGIAHRLLRAHHLDAGLPAEFQIIDTDDQLRLLKRLIKAMNLDEKQWPAKQAMWYIGGKKDEGLRPEHLQAYDPVERNWINIYKAYQEACDRAGMVDFAELLLRSHELWLNKPHILAHYQDRFSNILVDEFQDTNNIQYAWLRMLTGDRGNLMIVGDDDQSIYGWRGAQVENLQRFLTDFEGAKTIRLEQNYRSSSNILNAANALIINNSERMGKELWTEGVEGEPISLYASFNEVDEARFVIGRIKEWQDKGGSLSECAILYRNNAQSRVLEDALLQERLAYRIYGGLRFFDRLEIKDAMAYMRLKNNRDDDAAFERVVNKPTRGIGERALSLLRDASREQGSTLWQAAIYLLDNNLIAGRAASAIRNFVELITQLDSDVCDLALHEQIDHVVLYSGLKAMYQAEKGEKAQSRIENLEELVSAARSFKIPDDSEEMTELSAFLAFAALESAEGQADEFEDAVQLMTLHSAKGLEFPVVFMVGVEEGMFPSLQSAEESGRMEEERRLCYVGITRAMQKLYISYAESRRLYGKEMNHRPSRFIREVPEKYIEEIRLKTQIRQPTQFGRFSAGSEKVSFESTGYKLGQRVLHTKFGEGIVMNYEGTGPQSRIQIEFDQLGSKWLVVSYARLQAL